MNVLLVDDDDFLLDMYAVKFTALNHQVVTAHSAAEALQKLAGKTIFDAVVLDMIMPGMSGTELITEARTLYPNSPTKYIVLSNQGQEADLSEAAAAGANGYIIKAATIPSEVVARVEQILAGNFSQPHYVS